MSSTCTASSTSAPLAHAATLYAAINLHSDDADEAPEEVMNHAGSSASPSSEVAEDNDTPISGIQRSPMPSSIPAMPESSSGSSRRNKRKNFQPRNIRTADADSEVTDVAPEEMSDASGAEGNPQDEQRVNGHIRIPRHAEDRRKKSNKLVNETGSVVESTPLDLSEGLAPPAAMPFGVRAEFRNAGNDESCDDSGGGRGPMEDDDMLEADDDEDDEEEEEEDEDDEDGSISGGGSHSRKQQRSKDQSGCVVDLSLRATGTTSDSDEPEDSANEEAQLKMNTWMLLWQQQQQQQQQQQTHKSGRVPAGMHPLQFLQQRMAAGSVNRADGPAMKDYAETTMRELLGLYGLPRDAAAELALTSGRFLAPFNPSDRTSSPFPGRAPSAASGASGASAGGSAVTSSTPGQPPTPPHTPKTSNNNNSNNNNNNNNSSSSNGGSGAEGAGSLTGSDPSLLALQAHMQSVLRAAAAAGSASQASPASQPSQASQERDHPSTASVAHHLQNNNNKHPHGAMLPPHMAPFLTGLNDALIQHPQHPQQQQSSSINSIGVPVITSAASRKAAILSAGRGTGSGGGAGGGGKSTPIDYTRYVKRFSSALECGSPYCKDLNYREHFHCLDCNPRVFVKKEEMIRHFKWHKKRDESLQHGFMRYSPMDDCSDRFRGCSHNRKQTHYHCLKDGCDKVYISTSDVQMHANYHRKDSAIIQEGFQRYRATEDCATSYCAFAGQRTTHFHCRRSTCNYTFKNKADMEKHKSYHIKDEQLNRDGFKKFMKNEHCNFDGCRFSKVCNHIHCIRPGCTYVLHSSGQLYSHKRKHERRDSELAYHASGMNTATPSSGTLADSSSGGIGSGLGFNLPFGAGSLGLHSSIGADHPLVVNEMQQRFLSNLSASGADPSLAFLYSRIPASVISQLEAAHHASAASGRRSPSPVMSEEDAFRLCMAKVESGKSCQPGCDAHPEEHYHCRSDGCHQTFKCADAAKEHWRNHEQQEHISDNYYISVDIDEDPNPCPPSCLFQTQQRHYHCCWEGCSEIVLASDKPFRRLDHYKMHEYSRSHNAGSLSDHKEVMSATTSAFSLDSMFRRKRGRPPKNRIIEVWNESSQANSGSGQADTPQAIFTSFKLPKPNTPPLGHPATGTGTATSTSGSHFIPPYPIHPLGHPPSAGSRVQQQQSKGSSPEFARRTSVTPTTDKNSPELTCSTPAGIEPESPPPKSTAFSEMERLRPHMLKHCTGALSPSMGQFTNPPDHIQHSIKEEPESEAADKDEADEPAHAGPSSLSADAAGRASALHALSFMGTPYGLLPAPPSSASPASAPFLASGLQSIYANPGLLLGNSMVAFGTPGSPAAAASAKRPSPSPDLMNADAKKMRFQSSMRILKDEPVPEGYVRFRFNEDCQYPHCGYREHQTHFHCMRTDCGYSFCDKTRFVQHTARHERLDTLMGGDFQQYRANVSCGRSGCLYSASLGTVQNKASHFHCLKCEFVCTDTNKVVAHRRQHQKTDSILAAGFEKFTPSQSCRVDGCPHSNKQTHYHCLKCAYAVLGLAQMSAHKYRHLE